MPMREPPGCGPAHPYDGRAIAVKTIWKGDDAWRWPGGGASARFWGRAAEESSNTLMNAWLATNAAVMPVATRRGRPIRAGPEQVGQRSASCNPSSDRGQRDVHLRADSAADSVRVARRTEAAPRSPSSGSVEDGLVNRNKRELGGDEDLAALGGQTRPSRSLRGRSSRPSTRLRVMHARE